MHSLSNKLKIEQPIEDNRAKRFCEEFIDGSRPKYVLGTTNYAASIASKIDIDGFIDDYTIENSFLNKPIIKMDDIPQDSLVVSSVVLCRPLTARNRLTVKGKENLDYYAFKKYSKIDIEPVMYLESFKDTSEGSFKSDFLINTEKYERLYERLEDSDSKEQFQKIINFRLSHDIKYLEGFEDIQHRQYFESFLRLRNDGEVFIDGGGYDGIVSLEFSKRYPNYGSIHIFEPELKNIKIIKEKIQGNSNIYLHPMGLSNKEQALRFESNGSSSCISDDGDTEIKVNAIDNVIKHPFTYLKMDVEGEEIKALQGAWHSIVKYHPRLAISAYHCHNDLWKITEEVLSYRGDYKVRLRHYTEGVAETVLFFTPE